MNRNHAHRASSRALVQSLEQRRMMAADLAIVSINATPEVIPPGGDYSFSVTVANLGDTAVPSGWRMLPRLTQDATPGGSDDRSLGLRTVNQAINPGETKTFTVSTTTGVSGPRGQFRISVQLDPYANVTDANRGNNSLLTDGPLVHIVETFNSDTVVGTSGNDVITLREVDGYVLVNVNGTTTARQTGLIDESLFIDAGAGSDKVLADDSVTTRLAVTGGGGNDTIIGGRANDELSGANGHDRVFGGRGHDMLIGGAGADRLYGEDGNDILSGGGGNDWLYGNAGSNWLMGGAGNDKLFATNSDRDTVSGNAGSDYAETDTTDVVAGIEA